MTADVYGPLTRSRVMRAIKSKNTRPEKRVRSLLHAMGYRFRLHDAALPGAPDIIFSARRAVLFIHGCFWHAHDCPRGRREPKANAGYWKSKRERNARRDAKTSGALQERGWRVLVLWECELNDSASLAARLKLFLGPQRAVSA